MNEDILDDPVALLARDDRRLLRASATAGAQVRELTALTGDSGALRLVAGGPPRSLVIVADGEAGLAAPLLTALTGMQSPCPVLRLALGPLPNWVSAGDLVIVASLSRDRDPELAVLTDAAARRGTALLGIGAAGSALHERCTWARAPFVPVPADRIEGSALWSLLTPILLLAQELRLVDHTLSGTAAALDAMAELCRPDSESFVNPAKLLALQLGTALPVLVPDAPATAVVAERLRSGLARLAGVPAIVAPLPVALEEASAYLTGPHAPVAEERDIFRDRVDDAAPALRILTIRDEPVAEGTAHEALRELLRRADYAGVPVGELTAEESDRIGRLGALMALADFACVYLRLALTGLQR